MVEPLSTRTAQDLMMEPAVEEAMLIDGIMGGGLGFLVATPKAGKRWLVMDISVCVASGRPLWSHETQKGCVLHIPLEDTYERLKKRLWLITDEVEGNLHFATKAEGLGTGLLDQIAMFHEEHPDLALVVIDMLQMIREAGRDYSYSTDYRELSRLKRFADDHGITVLLIHHTRKMGDSDVMNTVSGTNGITGVADFTWVLAKPSRNSQEGTLSITGRDIEQCEIDLEFKNHRWCLVSDRCAKDLAAASIPTCVHEVVDFIQANGSWEGRTRELMREAGIDDVSPAVCGKFLAQHSKFLERNGVRYSKRHTSSGTLVTLEIIKDDDGNDSNDGNS